MLYLPGPGVRARSSEKHPVCDRFVIEYAAEAFLFAIFEPSRVGSEYEFGEGFGSPRIARYQEINITSLIDNILLTSHQPNPRWEC